MRPIREQEILRLNNGTREKVQDLITVERPITIYINGKETVTLLCTPYMVKELIAGFLLSEGWVIKKDDLLKIDYDELDGLVEVEIKEGQRIEERELSRPKTITSGCGKGLTTNFIKGLEKEKAVNSNIKVQGPKLHEVMKSFRERAGMFKETGAVHSAALWDPSASSGRGDEILSFAEDLGRHNAIDKVIGHCLLSDIEPKDKVLLTSGRISSEVLMKVARRGIPVIVSRNAPTSLSIELAEFLNLTIVGFVRGQRMNVYTHSYRVEQR